MKTIIALLLLGAGVCAAQDQQPTAPKHAPASGVSSDAQLASADPQKEPGPDFIPVEKQPVPVRNPGPVYPETARRTGLEGTVWLKVFIDEYGNPKKAEVIKSDNGIFDQPSIDAAMQWKFEPAKLPSGKTVAVWVTIPFKFRLSKSTGGFPGGDVNLPDPTKKPMH